MVVPTIKTLNFRKEIKVMKIAKMFSMRLDHSQDGSTFPGFKLTCLLNISGFF